MRLDLPIPDLLTALVAGGGVVLGLAVGVALLARRGGRHADAYLGWFLVAASLSVLGTIVGSLGLYRLSPHFYITPLFYTFSLGPLLYAFVRARAEPAWRPGRAALWHAALPAYQAVQTLASGLAPIAVKDWYWQTAYFGVWDAIETWLLPVHIGAYLWAARGVVGRAEGGAERAWLGRLVRGSLGIVAVVAGTTVAYRARAPFAGDWLELGAALAYAALLYWTALTGWVHALAPAAAPRQETYGMTPADLGRHADALRRHVADARPYLDPGLTLGALADALGLSDKELSYVLNAGLGTGYTDYVNGLRVAEAQRQLRDPARADATVLEIAMASGFASKATFNRAFKRATGATPTAFRDAPRRLMTS